MQDLEAAQSALSAKTHDFKRASNDLDRVEAALRTTKQDTKRLQDAMNSLDREQNALARLEGELKMLRRGQRDAERLIASLEAEVADKNQMIVERDRTIGERNSAA